MSRVVEYLIFVSCTVAILLVTLDRNLFLLAPPYAVTAYLMIFEHRVKFSKPSSVLVSYIAVIAVTAILHFAFGQSELSLAASVLLVSTFISFTKFSHPPAIALAIFSYLTNDIFSFIITTLFILAIIFLFTVLARVIIPNS
ncbi:MAG: HPP family protein [Nitrososphaeria archaeon]